MNEDYTHPPAPEASEASLNRDDKARRLATTREEALWLEAMLIHKAREEGRKEGRKEGREEGRQQGLQEVTQRIAKSFYDMGLPLDQISRGTDLPQAQLKKLLGIEDKPPG
ncbi:MAG: hypothetical protein ACFCBW_12165 [Candidatus Competibacterales bacterium]